MTTATYTYEQSLTYEVARDLLNTYVAVCSAEIGIEEAKPKPDKKRIEKIEAIQRGILLERDKMDMTDDQAMRNIIAKYRRVPGASEQQSA